MAKYVKITDYKKAYVTLLRQEGKLSLRQIATLCNISKSSVERISKLGIIIIIIIIINLFTVGFAIYIARRS